MNIEYYSIKILKEDFPMMYRVTFKGHDDEGNSIEGEWTFPTRGEADQKYCALAECSEWGDKIGFEEIGK